MNVSITFPPLPPGFSANPDGFLNWITDNAIFTADGESLSGQIGGTRPDDDVGIWFGENSIEQFRDGAYRPITDVPIGALVDFAGAGTAPENYLFCEGQSVLRADYPLLFAVIGTLYGSETVTTFTLPDLRGRCRIGADGLINAGGGDYTYQGITARLPSRQVASYNGFFHPRNAAQYPGAPTGAQGSRRFGGSAIPKSTTKTVGSVENPNLAMRVLIRYR